jgi:hypothetical protein
MATITRELLRKRSEHNECMISTMEEVRTEPQLRRKGDLPSSWKRKATPIRRQP